MPNYEVGALIKKLRKQKGISQEELAFPIIDRTTLSKIESGRNLPHRKTLEFLLDRLGFDADEYIRHFLTSEEAETKRSQSELHNIMRVRMRSNPERYLSEYGSRALELIAQLENDEEFISHPLNFQYVLYAKACHAANLSKDEEALDYIKRGLNVTIANFNEKDIANYYLSRHDRNLLIELAGLYQDMGRYDEAINIFRRLKENTEKMCMDARLRARRISIFTYNWANACLDAKQFADVIDVCEEGIKSCVAANDFFVFKELHWFKAQALLHLGKKDEFLQLAKKLYYAFDLHEDARAKTYAESIRKLVAEEFGPEGERFLQ